MEVTEPDVCVVEKNSGRTIERCLLSIRRCLPNSRIIVLDNDSTDESITIARKYADIVRTEQGYLGRVRYKAAQIASTPWIAFVDSDVYLYDQWYQRIKRYLANDKVAFVAALPDYPSLIPVYKEYYDYICWLHGTTTFSNTLVRRDLLLSCTELLNNIHVTEDWVVKKHILDLGFKTVTVKEQLYYHDKDLLKGNIRGYYRWGQSYRLKFGPKKAFYLGYLSYIRYQGIDWMNFSRTRRFSLTLLFTLALLGMIGFLGILRKLPPRPTSTQ